MDLASLVDPSRVVFGARANNKEQLLLDLASRAAAALNLDPKAIINDMRARTPVSKDSIVSSVCSRGSSGRSISTRSMPSPWISFFSFSFRRRPKASTSPRSPPSRDTCGTRNSPLDCAERQALPCCAAYFAIANILDLRNMRIILAPCRALHPMAGRSPPNLAGRRWRDYL
jgi:hypothetical protein